MIGLGGLDLIRCDGTLYRSSLLGTKFFDDRSPYYIGAYVKYLNWMSDSLRDWPQGIKDDLPVFETFSHYLKENLQISESNVDLFNQNVLQNQMFVAHTVFDHIDLGDSKRILDVGGNTGRFLATALTRWPQLTGTVFDLPAVKAKAEKQLAQWGLSERTSVVGGDFVNDPWPGGHDVISFIRILLSRSPEIVRSLFKKAYDLLPSGGRLLIVDMPILSSERGRYGSIGARVAMLMHIASKAGEIPHLSDVANMLVDVGFRTPDALLIDDPYGIVLARKP